MFMSEGFLWISEQKKAPKKIVSDDCQFSERSMTAPPPGLRHRLGTAPAAGTAAPARAVGGSIRWRWVVIRKPKQLTTRDPLALLLYTYLRPPRPFFPFPFTLPRPVPPPPLPSPGPSARTLAATTMIWRPSGMMTWYGVPSW